MPLEIPVLVVYILWAVAVGATAAAFNWRKIRKRLFGKRVAIVGPTQAGKTTLRRFLELGEIVIAEPTQGKDKIKRMTCRMKDLSLKISGGDDLQGGYRFEDVLTSWKKAVEAADIILYVFKANEIAANHAPTVARTLVELDSIAKWMDRKKQQIVLVGTHCDLDPNFPKSMIIAEEQKYLSDLKATGPGTKMMLKLGGLSVARCVAGTQTSKERMERLVMNLLQALT